MGTTMGSSEAITFPRALLAQARKNGAFPAVREKDLGIWQTWTWSEVADQVRDLACGLATVGLKRGANIGIIGGNRPRLYWAIAAAQSLGSVPIPLYQDSLAADLSFALDDAEIRFVIAEDQEQVDKILEIRSSNRQIHTVIIDDARGMHHYSDPGLVSLDAIQSLGRAYHSRHPEFFQQEVDKGSEDEIAVILYTSGTTGKPKGVCLTHGAIIEAARRGIEIEGLTRHEQILSYLPMAWMGDYIFSYAQALLAGYTVHCPESSDTVPIDLAEVSPTYYFAPPRIFENTRTSLLIRMEDAAWPKRRMFEYFMRIAATHGADLLDGKPVSLAARLLYALGNVLVYGPLKNSLGMSRVRVAYTAGAAIGPELFRFYRSIGIRLKQLYGSTETCVFVCLQSNDDVRYDTVGPPIPGIDLIIAEDGEIRVKSKTMFKEYYKRPEATASTFDQKGYLRTGDAGIIEPDGHVKIIDRIVDVGRLARGGLFAPNYLENKLKFFPFIKEAVTVGNGRERVCAMINIDLEAVSNWVERRGIQYARYTDLASKQQVYDLIQECIEKVNKELADSTQLADSQISRFLILHKELDPDDDELTRTRKLRRSFVLEKYAVLIDAMYAGRSTQHIETEVKFEDGRRGSIKAEVAIRDAKTYHASPGDTVENGRVAV